MPTRNLGLFRAILLAAMALAAPAVLFAQGTVSIRILDIPTACSPSEVIPLRIAFQKSPDVAEKRLVFVVEVRRTSDTAVLSTVVLDNLGHGYTGDSGETPCSLLVPADATGSIFFAARACPWSLNRAVVDQYKSYPTDGTYPYLWSGGGFGVTQDLYYLGALIAPTNASHTTYCSGITFETFLKSYENYNAAWGHTQIGALTASTMADYRKVWYGVTDADRLVAKAISDYGLGEQITDLEDVQEGDFVQFWRRSLSGHSVVFVGWERDASQAITGFRYWSSQTSTNGIGYGKEYFGETSGVNRARFWPARLKKPRDAADIVWSLGETDTHATPTVIPSPGSGWVLY